MKNNALTFLMSFAAVLWLATAVQAQEQHAAKGPKAVLPEVAFQFEPVLDGTQITHELVLQNKGTAPLAIHRVKTG